MIEHALYLFIAALMLAYLEVQIEGEHGWARKLPTWRPQGFLSNTYKRLMGGKELTGYHIGVFGMVFLFLHYPFFAGTMPWSFLQELWVLSIFFMFSVVWDYLWIIINPHYGVIKKRPQNDVAWHAVWWGPFPRDYYGGIALSLLVLYPLWSLDAQVLRDWGMLFGIMVVGTLVTLIFVELFRGDIKR